MGYYSKNGGLIGRGNISNPTGVHDIIISQLTPFVDGLYAFNTFTFTTAGVNGVYGPDLSTLQSAYSAESWTQDTNYFNVITQGIQRWKVPTTGTYTFVAQGASGQTPKPTVGYTVARGGYGASVTFDAELSQGDWINIVVGQTPPTFASFCAGGGGGTFIYDDLDNLIAAVGGGGGGGRLGFTWDYTLCDGKVASVTPELGNDGYHASESSPISRGGGTISGAGFGGWFGDGENRGAGGAGWLSDGQYGSFSGVTISSSTGKNCSGKSKNDGLSPWRGGLTSGVYAATSSSDSYNAGGFGGGGASGGHPTNGYGGGGGGYSGGGGSSWNTGSAPAGGGSTYVPGGFTTSTAGINTTNGSVQVTLNV